jgi:hypothetical protein
MTIFHEQGKTFLHSVWHDLTGLPRTEPPMENPAESNQEGKKP